MVTGLDAAGVPLQEEYVHRASIFSEHTGLPLGETVSATYIAENISFEMNKAKTLSPAEHLSLFLNKADRQKDLENSGKIINRLKGLQPGLKVITGCLEPETEIKNCVCVEE